MIDLVRLLFLQDYNTRVVLTGTALLGIASGVVGTLMLLRRRALIGDVASHAALPGVGIAYLTMERIQPGSGKWFPGLLLGATGSAMAGLAVSQLLRRIRRVPAPPESALRRHGARHALVGDAAVARALGAARLARARRRALAHEAPVARRAALAADAAPG